MTDSRSTERDNFFMKFGADKYVRLRLKKTNMDSGLKTALGIEDSLPGAGGDGSDDDGSGSANLVGSGFEAALFNGAVPVKLIYEGPSGKDQAAKVLCSPSKADTIFQDAIGNKYRGKRVTEVRFPRRRCYTW